MKPINLFSCTKCGGDLIDNLDNCPSCTWPLSKEGWKSTNRFIKTVTIDTNSINQKKKDPDLNKIEKWHSEGLISLQKTSVMMKELKGIERRKKARKIRDQNPVWVLGESCLGIDTYLAGPNLYCEIQAIQFPTTKVLNIQQMNDVDHLGLHVERGGDVFITKNTRDFIKNGKRERLMKFGIWVFDPHEFVIFTKSLYAWK